jgi:hypothetical protein
VGLSKLLVKRRSGYGLSQGHRALLPWTIPARDGNYNDEGTGTEAQCGVDVAFHMH